MSESWESIAGVLKERAQRMHEAREVGLTKCRALIQTSSKCIRHIHRHQFDEARALLQDAKAISAAARAALGPFQELYHAGFLHDAEKEMVEAAAVLAIIEDRPYPSADDLGVGIMSYLNGMGEAASEVRRYCLDEMRKGRLEKAENILQQMETIYDDLITFDFPDAMTGGLRRTTDQTRGILEKTRGDLTMAARQRDLERQLAGFQATLNRPAGG